MAEYIREEYSLDKVIFIPTGNPPQKLEKVLESAHHRYTGLSLLSTIIHFLISDTELKKWVSYL